MNVLETIRNEIKETEALLSRLRSAERCLIGREGSATEKVLQRVTKEATPLAQADKVKAVKELHAKGLTDGRIAEQLGLRSANSVLYIRKQLKLKHNFKPGYRKKAA